MTDQELRLHFLLLQILGMWAPNLDIMIFYGLYYLWRTLILLLMLIFFISEIGDLYMQKSVEGMTRNFLLSTVVFCSMLKVGILLLKRREIIKMLDSLKQPVCLPIIVGENKILNEYRQHAQRVGGGFLMFSFFTLSMQLIFPLVFGQGVNQRVLPFSAWLPYSIKRKVPYALTYFHLAVMALANMLLTVTSDNLISGFMIVTCSRLEILKFRFAHLHTLAELRNCVQYHHVILQFAERIEEIFGPVLFIQFMLSMINICSITFVIFKSESKAGCIVSTFFLICVMTQLLLYCWYGNEVFLKSQSVMKASMDNTDWVTLPIQMKKDLLLITIRSQKPMQLKAGWQLPLSLETFMMILKASYSAFNLLQHASTD